jgi:alpha-mannosidase
VTAAGLSSHLATSSFEYSNTSQLYPALFDRVKEKIDNGQFHLFDGSWVENDSNMPSGEALDRQFLYGQRFCEGR